MKPVAIALIAPALLLAGCNNQPTEPEQSQPTPQSTEWTTENPATPAVPVNLPETPMTNVPADTAAGATAAASPAAK
jgi:PBP1b-binding outer membrane lipoprotein LpoB